MLFHRSHQIIQKPFSMYCIDANVANERKTSNIDIFFQEIHDQPRTIRTEMQDALDAVALWHCRGVQMFKNRQFSFPHRPKMVQARQKSEIKYMSSNVRYFAGNLPFLAGKTIDTPYLFIPHALSSLLC